MHEPQANVGADQKFSPGRLKTRKGGLGKTGVDIKKSNKKQQSGMCYKGCIPKSKLRKDPSQDLK